MRESAQKMTLSSLPCSWSKISFLSRAEHRLRCANCSGCFDQCRNRCEPATHKPRPSRAPTAPHRCRWLQPQRSAAAAQPRVRPQARHPPSCLFRAATAVRCDAHTVRAQPHGILPSAALRSISSPSRSRSRLLRSRPFWTICSAAAQQNANDRHTFGPPSSAPCCAPLRHDGHHVALRVAWDGCINVRVFLAG